MMTLYRFIANLIFVVLYPYARLKMWQGSEMWRDRLGKGPLDRCDLWLHASSVGEVTIVGYLAAWLKLHRPELNIHVTTMTASGQATAKSKLNGNSSASYFPIDTRRIMRRTLEKLQPRLVVIAETEIWPNLITECSRRQIPLVKVNARISQKAFGRYLWVRKTIGGLISRYDRIFCKTEEDCRRYRELGGADAQVIVGGDLKFDAPLVEKKPQRVHALRQKLGIGEDEFLFVCGSTRPGEEAILLNVYREIKATHANFRMILAPRHLERLDEVRALIGQAGLAIDPVGNPSTNRDAILLVEKMGILNELYSAANLAFVGGTLVDIGGHNLLEPVWAQTPVIYGPSLSNVREAAQYIDSHRYGMCVQDGDEMIGLIGGVLDGRKQFAIKTTDDLNHSPVATAGQHILALLSHE